MEVTTVLNFSSTCTIYTVVILAT